MQLYAKQPNVTGVYNQRKLDGADMVIRRSEDKRAQNCSSENSSVYIRKT
jgi:hypothetical protein